MRILKLIFGCRHKRITWPQGSGIECHVSCLTCGERFRYDWKKMRRVA